MSDEPHFPPPGGQLGYREAAPSIPNDDSDGCSIEGVLRKRRVIATRPDDPDVAIAKATYPIEPAPRRKVSSSIVIAMLLVYVTLITTCALLAPPRHPPRSQTKSTPTAR